MDAPASKAVVKTVFLSLILDLLAFTIPLPLFPRLIAWYLARESDTSAIGQSSTLLSRLLSVSHAWRATLLALAPSLGHEGVVRDAAGAVSGAVQGKNWDVVLLGGAMGSLFSLCQCVISPWLGGLSDKYGRRRILLLTMLGNIASAVVWLKSTTFSSYLLSRVIGGLSEGNVQLSTAIISDVTTPSTRSRSLALVGIAFSICFTLGPSLGAYFASRPLPLKATRDSWNVFALPAAISLALLTFETLYLFFTLPETRHLKSTVPPPTATSVIKPDSPETRLRRLRRISTAHGLFLLFFSGAEFTLTFLTYDLFSASNAQNGRLLSFIGILSALLQARYVRPRMAAKGELALATTGIFSCILALALLAILPSSYIRSSSPRSTSVLYASAACLAYTSATVVSCLTAAAAGCCDEDVPRDVDEKGDQKDDPRLRRGRALGGYRSRGQLGRAIGPILASSVYWLLGPQVAYAGLAGCLVLVWTYVRGLARETGRRDGKGKVE